MFVRNMRICLLCNSNVFKRSSLSAPALATVTVLNANKRKFWNKSSKATDPTKNKVPLEDDSSDVLTSALLRSSRTHEGVREKLQQERRRLLDPSVVGSGTPQNDNAKSKISHVGSAGNDAKTSDSLGADSNLSSSTQPPHLSPLGLLRDDGPDKMESHKLDMDRELVRAYMKRRQEDDKKRRETDDGFWMGRSFPRSTVWTLWLSLGGNVAIAVAKFYAYTRTGHSAMFSEAVHTLVDVGNQVLCLFG